jgi:signal transduction histidine kinase
MGPQSEPMRGRRLPRGHGQEWAIIDAGEPFLCGDVQENDIRAFGVHAERNIRSCLAVPLVWRGKPLGLLQIDSQESDIFQTADRSLMKAVGALLSGPIELARRYQAEVQLRHDLDETRGRLEAILAHSPMGVLFFDRSHRLAYVNQAAVESLHLLPQQEFMLGRSWRELAELLAERRWDPEPSHLIEIIEQTQKLRDGVQVDSLPLRNPDQMLLRIAAPVFESGTFSGHVIIMVDVTPERRALEEAEQAIALRDRFISIASHELKTPLTSIKGAAQLMLRLHEMGMVDDDLIWKHFATIDAQAGRIRLLIDEMLDISRIQTGRIELRQEPLDLGELVTGVVSTLPEAQRERVRLTVASPIPGEWDPLRLEQITLNLLDNALKYSPASTTVDVRVERDGDAALLTVRDNGIGIPEADLAHLFEPFSRATNAAAHDDNGLGLGLYITRQLVELHGGTIDVQSAEGQGTVFRVRV